MAQQIDAPGNISEESSTDESESSSSEDSSSGEESGIEGVSLSKEKIDEFLTTLLPTANLKNFFNRNEKYFSNIFTLNSQKNIYIRYELQAKDDIINISLQIDGNMIFKEIKVYLDIDKKIHETNDKERQYKISSEQDSLNLLTNISEIHLKQNYLFQSERITSVLKKKSFLTIQLRIFYSFYPNSVDIKKELAIDLKNKIFTDFTVTTSDEVINVHRIVLYNASSFFKTMIDTNMKEKITGNIDLRQWDTKIVKEFINYIYDLNYNLSVGVQDLFELAHVYDVKGLQEECEEFMIRFLNKENIITTLKLLEIQSIKNLKIETENFIKSNAQELFKDDEFVEYYSKSIKIENIDSRFKFAMKNYNECYKNEVIKYILENAAEVYGNESFEKLLIDNPKWNYELSKHVSLKYKEKYCQPEESTSEVAQKKRKLSNSDLSL